MNDPNRPSPHYLVAKYIQGDLSPEESQMLLQLLQRNESIVQLLKSNVLADALLCEIKQQTSLADNQMNTTELTELFNKAADSIEPCHEEERFSSGPVGMDTQTDWDELVRIQNSAQPIATMTPSPESNSSFSKSENHREPKPYITSGTTVERRKNHTRPQNKPRKWAMNDYAFVACILMAIVLGFGVYFDQHKEHDPSPLWSSVAMEEEKFAPVARVTELIDPVWATGATTYQRGQSIETGKLSLTQGMAQIEFQNGAVLTLEAPIHFTINGIKETFCSLGELSATVPPSATGFRVKTPMGTVEDHGTEFFVKVAPDKLEVETNKGLVEIIRTDRSSLPLKEGEAIHFGHDGTSQRYVPEIPRFTTWKVFGIRLASYIAKLRKEKEQADMILDADPNLLVRFDPSYRQGDTVPNMSAAGKSRCPELNLQRAPIVEGRWNASAAIGFTNRTDNVSFRLDGTYRRLTLTANIRFDHLGTQENTLCASRDFMKVPGSFLWQICRTGEIIVFVTTSENKVKPYPSSPVMNVRNCGIWYKLSVVLDADEGTISHYVNSNLISTVEWRQPQDIIPGECLLGRAPQNVLKGISKHFDGAIDEFQISTKK